MKRAILAVAIGACLTALACVILNASEGIGSGVVWAVAIGGALGSLVAGASAGAQVAFLLRKPLSNSSMGAMVAGFFAKMLVLVAGILLLHFTGSSLSPTAFGVSFLLASAVVSAIALSAIAKSFRA